MPKRKISSTNYLNEQVLAENCPMQYAMQLLSGRWKIVILWYVEAGLNRFSVLRRHINSVTPKMLTQQLRELETDGFLVRSVINSKPLHIEYHLTEKAKTLMPVLAGLNEWAVMQSGYAGQSCEITTVNLAERQRVG